MNNDQKGKGNILKIIELGLENRVFDAMKQPSFSVEKLTRKLTEEGIGITAQSIRKFIKKSKKAQQELISQDLQTNEILKGTIIDYGKALKSILQEVEEVKNTARHEKDYATYNQLVGRIMQGIELIAKLTGDIRPKGSIDINLVYQEINLDVESRMKKLKDDIIKETAIDVDSEIREEDLTNEERLNKKG